MKYTAIAPANIAFIKYWGKKDEALRIPLNASFSMTTDAAYATTTVDFSGSYAQDEIILLGGELSEKETSRVCVFLDRMRVMAGKKIYAKVVSQNSFPKGAGAASSASGFAALTLAGAKAIGLSLAEKELTILARIGSGSACRSIPDGFVLWETGDRSEDSFAHSLYPHDYWDLRDMLLIVSSKEKKVGSTEGMVGVTTSPLLLSRLSGIPKKILSIKHAFAKKDFKAFGKIIEEESENMHQVMMTQNPALHYRTTVTMEILEAVKQWRNQGIFVYTTVDAGPNVHCIFEKKDEEQVCAYVSQLQGVEKTILSAPAPGAHCISEHLF